LSIKGAFAPFCVFCKYTAIKYIPILRGRAFGFGSNVKSHGYSKEILPRM
jgi:hypothetical protein